MSSDKSAQNPLPASTARNLVDKLYEKRKLGALEVEQLVRGLAGKPDGDVEVKKLIEYIVSEYIGSSNGNAKKGGLIALAAVGIGLGASTGDYADYLIPGVLSCFTDQDVRVRYYACESLYNITKVSRTRVLRYFNEIFDGLCKLAADPDQTVKNGSQLLDRLLKDVVSEAGNFDVERFIPLLQERLYVVNPFCRQFLLSWISTLDAVPDIDMLSYLPRFMDGVFNMLKDTTKGIRQGADVLLSEFLREIKEGPREQHVEYDALTKILLSHCQSKDDFTRLTALVFINEFLAIGGARLLPLTAELMAGILPTLSHESDSIQEAAIRANVSLMKLVADSGDEFRPERDFTEALTLQLVNRNVATRLAALRWILMLHEQMASELAAQMNDLFPAMLKMLSDASEDVVRLDLEVMAMVASDDAYFERLVSDLVKLFSTDRQLLDDRSSMIVRQLCAYLPAEKLYLALAAIVESDDDYDFARVMTQTLNLILLTSPELLDTRTKLKGLDTSSSRDLFTALYRSWCHNPTAVFSLCLLAGVYEHAYELVQEFANIEVTVAFLVEIDKLVQLLESPVFIHLRLQLIEPQAHPYLFKCLYGLLMLLPQSTAFELLRTRLNAVSSLGVLQLIPPPSDATRKKKQPMDVSFTDLLKHFVTVQAMHAKHAHRHTAR